MILLCSNCRYFEVLNKKASCTEGYWKGMPLKNAILYSPFDFDCLSYETKQEVSDTFLLEKKESKL